MILSSAGGFALGIAVFHLMAGIEERVRLSRFQRGVILFTLLFLATRFAIIMTGGNDGHLDR
jgi:hypothetical protein